MTTNIYFLKARVVNGQSYNYYPWKGCGSLCGFWSDELYKVPSASDKIISVLGNVKGVISSEDRQLLKIAHNLSEKDVDTLISDYKMEYTNHLNLQDLGEMKNGNHDRTECLSEDGNKRNYMLRGETRG